MDEFHFIFSCYCVFLRILNFNYKVELKSPLFEPEAREISIMEPKTMG
jgi:hypothetical protein